MIKKKMTRGLDEIEVRGEIMENVWQNFVRPNVFAWKDISQVWGVKEI